jgi:hypothetical protein
MTTITNPLLINYTVTVVNNQYIITWASTLSPVTFDVASASFISRSGNYFDAGDSNNALTTLDYTLCTSPTGASKTILIAALIALSSSSLSTAALQVTSMGTGVLHSDSSGNVTSSAMSSADNVVVTTGTVAQSIDGVKTFSSGVKYATSGGTATSLTYYEEVTINVQANILWASTQGCSAVFTRIGNIVTVRLPSTLANATSAASIGFPQWPARFTPSSTDTKLFPIFVQDNGTRVAGLFAIANASPAVSVGTGTTFSGLSGSGTSGFTSITVTYPLT